MSDRDRDEQRGRGYDDDRERYPRGAGRSGGNQSVIIALIAAGTVIIVLLILLLTGVIGGTRGSEPTANQQATQAQAAPGGNLAATPDSTAPGAGNATAAAPPPAATASVEFPAEFRGTWCDAGASEFLIFTSDQLRVEQRDSSGAVTSSQTRRLTGRSGGEYVLDDGTRFSIFEGPGNPAATRGGRNIEVDLTRGPLKTYGQC